MKKNLLALALPPHPHPHQCWKSVCLPQSLASGYHSPNFNHPQKNTEQRRSKCLRQRHFDGVGVRSVHTGSLPALPTEHLGWQSLWPASLSSCGYSWGDAQQQRIFSRASLARPARCVCVLGVGGALKAFISCWQHGPSRWHASSWAQTVKFGTSKGLGTPGWPYLEAECLALVYGDKELTPYWSFTLSGFWWVAKRSSEPKTLLSEGKTQSTLGSLGKETE